MDCTVSVSGCSNEPVCDDGIKDPSEACDSDDFGSATCSDYGFNTGTLTCNNCSISASSCSNVATCDNGVAELDEACDGDDLKGAVCSEFGFDSGTPSCSSDCSAISADGCFNAPVCGDNTKNGSDACDGTDFGDFTCETYGFDSGALSCTPSCTVDASNCFNAPVCGDGVKNGNDACDGDVR